jgi:crotonobetainyl-CoA:carnitine CoA-transferase CaiB-like acyl-CoA transferase
MAEKLPLDGVRIADFSWVLAGPHCTKWLGALGAEVIKVESHFRPDRFRAVPPFINDQQAMDTSVVWNMLNYSKRDCTINLGTEEGRALARQLVAASDVVIENYATGVAERLGLSYAELSAMRPSLVMVSSSGLGRTGPDTEMRAFGKSIHGFSGHTYLAGWPGTPPRGIGGTWTDPLTGVTAALAILAGLAYARRTGQGLHIDLSMAEATIALMAEPFLAYLATGEEPQPAGNLAAYTPHNSYRCGDDRWLAIAAHDAQEWRALCAVTAMPAALTALEDGAARAARRAEIDAAIDAWCRTRSRQEALGRLHEAGVCCAPVLDHRAMLADEHFAAREMLEELVNEGHGAYHILKLPWRQEPDSTARYRPAPKLGQDNEYVFTEILKLAPEAITRLTASDVLI